MKQALEVQGHRGARGLKPENTLPSIEIALDLGVSAIETDLHLSADRALVLYHDPNISDCLCAPSSGTSGSPPVRELTLAELRRYRVDRNPHPLRFPRQDSTPTPLACAFAEQHGIDPLGIPTVAELFDFAAAYAGELGGLVGKSPTQRQRAAQARFDLELKRVPFFPETIGDGFDGRSPGPLEIALVEQIRAAGVLGRCAVRSFDHRSVRAVRLLERQLQTVVLVSDNAPLDPVRLADEAGASIYGPDFRFVDESMIRKLHEGDKRVIAWTVNEPSEWEKLVAWGVDGITTDVPDLLLAWLAARSIAVL